MLPTHLRQKLWRLAIGLLVGLGGCGEPTPALPSIHPTPTLSPITQTPTPTPVATITLLPTTTPTRIAPIGFNLGASCEPASLSADFVARDQLPESTLATREWYKKNWNNGWGPAAAAYPVVTAPTGCEPMSWKRARIVAVARKYIGLAYQHHHIPAWDPPTTLTRLPNESAGLDCSNFTAWVYNYGLGIRFTSDVLLQADGKTAPGRRLLPTEKPAMGDLVFLLKQDRSEVSHVVIYIDAQHVIDSHGAFGGVTEHAPMGWYSTHVAWVRRVLE